MHAMPSSPTPLQEAVDAVPFWMHSIDLGEGVVTPGHKTPERLREELAAMRLPDLTGRTVLDVGTWDGFFAFEAERRGAARTVALDSYIWAQDLRSHAPPERQSTPAPGNAGFELARRTLASGVEPVVMEVLDMTPEALGTFDVVLFLGVIYHMQHPLAALQRLRSVTRDVAIIETQLNAVGGLEHIALWEFLEGGELNDDPTNWWVPNEKGLVGLLRTAGFARAEVVEVLAGRPDPDAPGMHARRAVAHAYV
jgi:tRNA (mo5U34)-methyltransferase